MDMIKIVDGFVQFNDVEYTIEKMLSDYQDKYINEIPPFDTLNPTLENICLHFKDCIDEQMKNMGWLLLKIEISETPTRSYMIDLIIDFQQENGKYLSEKSAYETTAQELEKIINSINS